MDRDIEEKVFLTNEIEVLTRKSVSRPSLSDLRFDVLRLFPG